MSGKIAINKRLKKTNNHNHNMFTNLLNRKNNDDYIDRTHARSTKIENGYLPCACAWSSQCAGIAI